MIEVILALIIGYAIGHSYGYHYAHQIVAKECERLGGFYVGTKTYRCTEIIEENENDGTKTVSNVVPA